MSKHYKMYIMINNIIDEKRVDLVYPIRDKEVAVVRVFSDNIKYEFVKPWMLDFGSSSKQIAAGTYTGRELIGLREGKIEITQSDKDSRIKRMNKLEGFTEMVFNLDELDNTNNFKNRSPSNTLLNTFRSLRPSV